MLSSEIAERLRDADDVLWQKRVVHQAKKAGDGMSNWWLSC